MPTLARQHRSAAAAQSTLLAMRFTAATTHCRRPLPTRKNKAMSFAEKIKSAREQLGLTQAEAAALLDVSPRAVWQWEQGQEPIVLTQEGALQRLAKTKAKKK